MSNVKYDAITGRGIEVGERVNIPDALVPADARVEMEAKMAAGYFTAGAVPDADDLAEVPRAGGWVTPTRDSAEHGAQGLRPGTRAVRRAPARRLDAGAVRGDSPRSSSPTSMPSLRGRSPRSRAAA